MKTKTLLKGEKKRKGTTIYLSKDLDNLLDKEAKKLKCSKSSINEDALKMYFSPSKEEERIDAISRRLLKLDSRLNKVDYSTKVLSEILVTFLKTWLLYNPELPDEKNEALKPQMLKRHQNLLQMVTKNISEGKTIFDLLPSAPKTMTDSDFSKLDLPIDGKK